MNPLSPGSPAEANAVNRKKPAKMGITVATPP